MHMVQSEDDNNYIFKNEIFPFITKNKEMFKHAP